MSPMARSQSPRSGSALRRHLMPLLAAALLTAGLAVAVAEPAGAAGCHVTWGSLGKTSNRQSLAPIVGARAGQHLCYDRFVIDLRSTPTAGYYVRYVRQVVEDGSGHPVPLRGGAFIQVSVRAPAYDLAGHTTYRPAKASEAVSVTGFHTFRQIAYAGSYEGTTTFGLGVRARLPFRVFTLTGPGAGSRVVIDVAHTWG